MFVGKAGAGIALLVGAGAMAEFLAKCCSSPQTVEINISQREQTLMKWVNIGVAEGAAMVVIAAAVDKEYAKYLLWGAALEGALSYGQYIYAKRSGLANPGPATEVTGGYG